MYTLNQNCTMYIPNERQVVFTDKVTEKVNFLSSHPSLKGGLIGLPDFGDDDLGLNGLYFQANEMVFPMGAGMDVGCGFHLLHVKGSDVDLNRLEKELTSFAENVTSPRSGMNMTEQDIEEIYKNPKKWCEKHEIGVDITKEVVYNEDRPTKFNATEIANSFARLAKGNHFIELRKVGEVKDVESFNSLGFSTDDIFIHIHSGSGVFAERSFLKHFLALNDYEMPGENGYEVYDSINREETQDYLADVERSKRIAETNRYVLAHLLKKWIDAPTQTILDIPHDYIKQEGNVIHHHKAVQRYTPFKHEQVAIIPATIVNATLLVKQKDSFPFVNHGVGDGETGSSIQVNNVITNFTKPITRKFFNTAPVFDLCEDLQWFEPIAELTPWMCIKNTGKW